LQLELAVAAAPLLTDRAALERIETGTREVDLVEHGKRQRQHDVVVSDFAARAALLERQPVATAGGLLDLRQTPAAAEPIAEIGRDRFRQALVAAADVKLLVRLAEDGELAFGRLKREQVEDV